MPKKEGPALKKVKTEEAGLPSDREALALLAASPGKLAVAVAREKAEHAKEVAKLQGEVAGLRDENAALQAQLAQSKSKGKAKTKNDQSSGRKIRAEFGASTAFDYENGMERGGLNADGEAIAETEDLMGAAVVVEPSVHSNKIIYRYVVLQTLSGSAFFGVADKRGADAVETGRWDDKDCHFEFTEVPGIFGRHVDIKDGSIVTVTLDFGAKSLAVSCLDPGEAWPEEAEVVEDLPLEGSECRDEDAKSEDEREYDEDDDEDASSREEEDKEESQLDRSWPDRVKDGQGVYVGMLMMGERTKVMLLDCYEH